MKTIRTIIALFLLGGCCTFLQAQTYSMSASSSPMMYSMQSTSPVMPYSYQGQTYTPGAAAPAYVEAGSGDLNPFGASKPTSSGLRRAPGKTGGEDNKDNPDIDGPITDGTWFLVILAGLFAAFKFLPRMRKEGE